VINAFAPLIGLMNDRECRLMIEASYKQLKSAFRSDCSELLYQLDQGKTIDQVISRVKKLEVNTIKLMILIRELGQVSFKGASDPQFRPLIELYSPDSFVNDIV